LDASKHERARRDLLGATMLGERDGATAAFV